MAFLLRKKLMKNGMQLTLKENATRFSFLRITSEKLFLFVTHAISY